jgi:hypothetical protein
MVCYQKEKIENSILFLSREYYKKNFRYLCQSILYKMLSMIDYYGVTETGKPILGLTPLALANGPVPNEIYNNYEQYNFQLFEINEYNYRGKKRKRVIPSDAEVNKDYFSDVELEVIEKVFTMFSSPSVGVKEASDICHKVITNWDEIRAEKSNLPFDFGLYFKNFSTKPAECFTPQEEKLCAFKKLSGKA